MSKNKENFSASEKANEYVRWLEKEWLKNKWAEFAVYQGCADGEELADQVLEEISKEVKRLDDKKGNV